MDLLSVVDGLWRAKWSAVAMAVIAALVATLITFRVTLSPFGLSGRIAPIGVGQTEVLVNADRSALADSYIPSSQLASIASDYTELVDTRAILQQAGAAVGAPASAIGVSEQLAQIAPFAQTDAREAQVANQILAGRKRFEVLVRNDQGTFVIQIFTQARTATLAERLADAVAQGLVKFQRTSASNSGQIPAGEQVRLVQLAPAVGGLVDAGLSSEVAVAAGVLTWIFGMIAILTFRRVRRERGGAGHWLSSDTQNADQVSA